MADERYGEDWDKEGRGAVERGQLATPSEEALEAAQRRADELIDYWDLTSEGHALEQADNDVDAVIREIVFAAYDAADSSAEEVDG